ncbi:unnamed protein product [Thelazia callipaeda]|uniref:Uncharacterized protein n=1 Tax=Thelazia callipaeda TaxID=103827 RepID=A0A0N5CMQ5_THECL|nr:unnamed protein product [Thelazia callipaeda]
MGSFSLQSADSIFCSPMYSAVIFIFVASTNAIPLNYKDANEIHAWKWNSTRTGRILADELPLSPLDSIARANKVSSIAFETFGELNQFWGNAIRFLQYLAQIFEPILTALIETIFPDSIHDLNQKVITHPSTAKPQPSATASFAAF